jgi:hypothetical protein
VIPYMRVVIDDSSMYGNSMRMARDFWYKFGGGREAIFSSIYCSPPKYHIHGPMPDLWQVDLDDPHYLEWCLFNCGYARKMAYDFDGVLTREGTSRLMYAPRKYEVPLIITGRLESERTRSEKWLEQHNIKASRMIMWPSSMEEREAGGFKAIAAFKAKHFAESPLDVYVESDPDQAKEIAKLSRKTVICPTVAEVYL